MADPRNGGPESLFHSELTNLCGTRMIIEWRSLLRLQVTCPKGHLSEMELCRFRNLTLTLILYITLTLCLYVSEFRQMTALLLREGVIGRGRVWGRQGEGKKGMGRKGRQEARGGSRIPMCMFKFSLE